MRSIIVITVILLFLIANYNGLIARVRKKEVFNFLMNITNIGTKMPEIAGIDDDNATIYIKANVINPKYRIINASNFPMQVNYNNTRGMPRICMICTNYAEMIQKLIASDLDLVVSISNTGDRYQGAFLNSYISTYSEELSVDISFMETKDCTVTKGYSNLHVNGLLP
ncbi:hypothetical protein [Candidatus Nitrosocosmicus franklandus]|uniref:Uncharacterized protein n=1 Tax=Candidatus Nitrosocosmicus franklandianus TaxID=1798806 RepID=A0A484I897_9ARCH|nr:hypothetical protein [Candidatus Nitrosocosmicus franklandus]VFJ13981.1 protein of unknown function [Candidatus Nitrosocosmicus franklandus]